MACGKWEGGRSSVSIDDHPPTTIRSNGRPAPPLTIGEAARRSGFTVKALRFYERRGLLPPSGRRPSGYRLYAEADLHRLEFIRQAKALGLSLEAIRELVTAAREPGGVGARPRLLQMLEEHIAQTARQIDTLTRLRQELERRRRALAREPQLDHAAGYCPCLESTGRSAVPRIRETKATWRRSGPSRPRIR